MKRLISLMLVFMMTLGIMPIGEILVYADENPELTEIEMVRTYKGGSLDKLTVRLSGIRLDKAKIYFGSTAGSEVETPKINDPGFIVYELKDNKYNNIVITTNGAPKTYSIDESDLPTINSIDPSNGRINAGKEVILNGKGFSKLEPIDPSNVKGYFIGPEPSNRIESLDITSNKEIKKIVGQTTGPYGVKFEEITPKSVDAPKITRIHNYEELFDVYGELNISNNITMIPNRGSKGSYITLEAPGAPDKGLLPEKDMSVFFLKDSDISDTYKQSNMGTDETYTPGSASKKDKFSVKVPNLEVGRYRVIITNNVDPGGKVTSTKTFENNIFIVVDGDNTASITGMDPNTGPETGIDSRIQGKYIGTLSSTIFETNKKPEILESSKGKTYLDVEYKADSAGASIGNYKSLGDAEDGIKVAKITRRITISIGGTEVKFNDAIFSDSSDNFYITVPPNTLKEGDNPKKDVSVTVVTTIYPLDGSKPIPITEVSPWNKKFEYQPVRFIPEITKIIPNKIPVDIDNKTTEEIEIHIIGKNFLKYKYTNKNNEVRVKYPVVDIAEQLILNKNIPSKDSNGNANTAPPKTKIGDEVKLEVYNKGNIVDGTTGNELGDKIIITLPKGTEIKKGIVDVKSQLKVLNVTKDDSDIVDAVTSESSTVIPSASGDIFFVEVGYENTPIITGVTPSTVTTDGEKGIIIEGSNFKDPVFVYLDGELISGAIRNGRGTEIIFDAPKKALEGSYQIIVQNEGGGLATFDEFIYVKTYTNIKLTDFAPKKGSANTLVSIKGENFVPMDPLVRDISGAGIYKLIGTRVFLGGVDVNNYQEVGGKPILKPFNPKKAIIKNKDGRLETENYHDSVVLIGNDKYYKIYINARTGKTILTDGNQEVFELAVKNDKIYARKINIVDGKPVGTDRIVDLSVPNKVKVEAKDGGSAISLDIYTLYLTNKDNNEIIGNNVKILNDGEIMFTVPPKSKPGYYDLMVMNPDNKKDSKTGNAGFLYFLAPPSNPKIETITPDQGSTQGDYFVEIEGEDFKDTLSGKTSVIIGGITVDPKDIQISTDGKIIRFKVPKYPGDLNKETDTGRKTVPVVVLNPDGASANKEEGFTYVIPISNPKITALILNKGTAAGGETVSVEGDDFRFFEPFRDINNNRIWDDEEPYTDSNGNGKYDEGEPFEDTTKDGNGKSDGIWNPAELFDDLNKDRKWTDLKGKKVSELSKEDKAILPTIYFGNQAVEILSFAEGSIEIKTPKGEKGSVDVYLVNNDYGVSNKVKYTYEASSPKINSIVPNVGRKQGGDKVEILGESFYESTVKVINSSNSTKDQTLQLARFGDLKDKNMSNRDVAIDAPLNSGRIKNGLATVKVGNLTIKYDATGSEKKLDFTLDEKRDDKDIKYSLPYTKYDDDEIFLPISELKDTEGKSPSVGDEYIRISLETIAGASATKKLRIDRGFSPKATIINSGQIALETPSYYTVGKIKVTIINPDGSTAEGDFEYKNPDSKPEITNVLRDTQEGKIEKYVEGGKEKTRKIVRVNVSGGNTIDIEGKDFRKPVKIKIGDIPEITTGIDYTPNESISQKMSFKMPKVDDKYVGTRHRIVIENEDGGTAGSDESKTPIYIEFIKGESTGLTITGVTPSAGPTAGGTKITILGKDFRRTMEGFDGEKLKVYFGEGKDKILVSDSNIESVTIDKIVLKTPPHKAGKVTITVENPDGSITELKDAFTYISNPKITKIVDPLNGDIRKETLSIEGGETIKIVGRDFSEGARVILSPVLKEVSKNPTLAGDRIFINGIEYILESGVEGTDTDVIDSNNIKVITPKGKLETGGVIVINPDNAATPEYKLDYAIPEITAPQDVRASLIKDEYIRINWNTVVDKATEADGKTVQYEVYAITGNSREFIGSTGSTGFVFRDLKPNTTYKFLVRAVGKYGSSKPIDESVSNPVTTDSKSGPKDDDGVLGEKTTVNKTGDTANIVIGDNAFSQGDEYVIDLTRGTLSGSDKLVVSMSAKIVVTGSSRKIKIVGKDYGLSFSPNVFENATVVTNKDNPNAGVKFEVTPTNTNFDLAQNNGDIILASRYFLRGRTYVSASSNEIENLKGKMNFILDYNENMAKTRRIDFVNIRLVKYDAYDRKFKNITSNSGYGTSTGDINELGTYTITGSRR